MSSLLTLHGRATIGPANDLLDSQLQQLIEDGTSKMLVNLTDVTQLDSSSIGSIVRAFVSLKRRGASLKLLRPRGNVRLVLETVHLLDVIPTIEDETRSDCQLPLGRSAYPELAVVASIAASLVTEGKHGDCDPARAIFRANQNSSGLPDSRHFLRGLVASSFLGFFNRLVVLLAAMVFPPFLGIAPLGRYAL